MNDHTQFEQPNRAIRLSSVTEAVRPDVADLAGMFEEAPSALYMRSAANSQGYVLESTRGLRATFLDALQRLPVLVIPRRVD